MLLEYSMLPSLKRSWELSCGFGTLAALIITTVIRRRRRRKEIKFMLLEYAVLSQDNHLFIPAEVLVIVVWFGVLAALIIIIVRRKSRKEIKFCTAHHLP